MGRPKKVVIEPVIEIQTNQPQESPKPQTSISPEKYNALKLEAIQIHDWLKTVTTRLRNISNQDAQELCNTVTIRNANFGKVIHEP